MVIIGFLGLWWRTREKELVACVECEVLYMDIMYLHIVSEKITLQTQ